MKLATARPPFSRLARSTAADKSRLKLIAFSGGSRNEQILEQPCLRRAL